MPPHFALAPWLFVLLWSTGFIATKAALEHADPFSFLLLRFALAALLMALLTVLLRGDWPRREQLPQAALAGVLLHAGYLGGVSYGIWAALPAGVMAVLVGLQPLLTAALSGPLLGEYPKRAAWWGLALGFLGVLMLVLGRGQTFALAPTALLAAGIALLSTTAGSLYQRAKGGQIPLLGGTAVQYAASAGVMLPLALLYGQGISYTPALLGALAWLLLVLSVGAVLLLLVLLRSLPAAQVSSLLYLVPPLTLLEAFVLFGERLPPLGILGALLCVAGVALSLRRR